jgi:hypothetical protein
MAQDDDGARRMIAFAAAAIAAQTTACHGMPCYPSGFAGFLAFWGLAIGSLVGVVIVLAAVMIADGRQERTEDEREGGEL